MKILTVCHKGNVRSVALAFLLKQLGHEAIAIGVDTTTPKTQELLSNWANKVIAVQPSIKNRLPIKTRAKTIVFDVGPDTYKDAKNLNLARKFGKYIQESGLFTA